MSFIMKGSMLIIEYISLIRLLEDFVDKAARYMETNTHKNILFFKSDIRQF